MNNRQRRQLLQHEQVRQLQRKCRNRLIVFWISLGVFLLFVVGNAWFLAFYDYQWAEGELAADIATIVVALVLAVFFGIRARVIGRQAAALDAELPGRQLIWLPHVSDDDSAGVELEAQIPRLRTTSRRAVAWCVAWIGVLLVGMSAYALLAVIGQRLLDRGTQVVGTVMGAYDDESGFRSTVTVRYLLGETVRFADINRNSDLLYMPGNTLTVVYDPADPERVRTEHERNDNEFVSLAGFVLIILACFGIPFSVIAARGWRQRYRAVRASGWSPATAYPTQETNIPPTMIAEFHDGSTISLRAAVSLRALLSEEEYSDVPVWVGGADRHMVVLLPRDWPNKGPHAVPVKAAGPRFK